MAEANVERLFDGRKLEELPRTRKEAQETGSRFYYPGPCKYGHEEPWWFSGRRCAECQRISVRAWQARNEGYYKDWEKANAEGRKKQVADYFQQNKAEIMRQRREKRASNPESHKERERAYSRKWREANAEKSREANRKWSRENRDKVRAIAHKKRAVKLQAEGFHTPADIDRIFDQQRGKCACCKTSLSLAKRNFEVDHIAPLSKGGTNWPSNLQILCPSCNSSKKDKDPIVFMQARGFLL